MRAFYLASPWLGTANHLFRRLLPPNRPQNGALILLLFLASSTAAQSHQPAIADADLPDAPQAQSQTQTQIPAQVQIQTQTQAQPPPQPPEDPHSASLHGAVVDPEGSVYQGVQVTLTGPNPPITLQSDSDGRYLFENLPAGSWKLTFSAQGFATQVLKIELQPGQSLEAPSLTLLMASATTDVQVTASTQEIAQAQLMQEEQQRVFGIIPNFYVVYDRNPAPLTPRQKFHLAWRSSIDPVTFLATGFFAGIEQADNTFPGYGQGAQGYAKRFGANYADNFIGTMIGGAILPSILKQDPRYYYKGTGSTRSRILYAIANSVMCKGDNGHWQVNYSGLLGGAAAGGISNLYYPAADRNGIDLTIENTALGIAGSAAQNLFQEFLVRKLTPKLPKINSTQP